MTKNEQTVREIALTTIRHRSGIAADICALRVRNLERLIRFPTVSQVITAIEVGLAQSFDTRSHG